MNTETETLVRLLDKIIMSDNPSVKDAFRELLIVASLTHNDTANGPWTYLNDIIDKLRSQMHQLEDANASLMARVSSLEITKGSAVPSNPFASDWITQVAPPITEITVQPARHTEDNVTHLHPLHRDDD